MKKICFIIFVFLLVIAAIEFSFYKINKYSYFKQISTSDFDFNKDVKYNFRCRLFKNYFNSSFLRPVALPTSGIVKNKILLFGCSYVYGASLNENETFSYKLANKFNAKVYNRAFSGWGLQNMLMQLKETDTDLNISSIPDKDINTVIYIFINDHLNRLNNFYWGNIFFNVINFRYIYVKNNTLKVANTKPDFIHGFYIFKTFHNIADKIKNSKSKYKNNCILMSEILKESHDILIRHYPNCNFIFIAYNETHSEEFKKMVENAGWKYYQTDELLDEKINLEDEIYHFKNDTHPRGAAWDVIVDAIARKRLIKS